MRAFNLSKLPKGIIGRIKKIELDEVLEKRLHKLGFINEIKIEFIRSSPFGDPRVYRILNTLIAIRNTIARKILVEVKNEPKDN
jgi:ferrous iron transport protein A